MVYRVKQFIKAMTASITEEEYKWVNQYLSSQEQNLFLKLKVYEQRHCLDVAKCLEVRTDGREDMIRLGLLHDIGKIKYPLNPIEKSIIVLLDCLTKGKIKKLHWLKMVKCYYHHADIGYEMLKTIDDYDEKFLRIIKKHHEHQAKEGDIILLQEADDLC